MTQESRLARVHIIAFVGSGLMFLGLVLPIVPAFFLTHTTGKRLPFRDEFRTLCQTPSANVRAVFDMRRSATVTRKRRASRSGGSSR